MRLDPMVPRLVRGRTLMIAVAAIHAACGGGAVHATVSQASAAPEPKDKGVEPTLSPPRLDANPFDDAVLTNRRPLLSFFAPAGPPGAFGHLHVHRSRGRTS